ncbi:hypothetical protein PCANC_10620 [Puccinia coronata f. sp. avenae]|nr:hypothetical protein PCANC_10620 [Puccinia coronata f. sp. avenae]
MPPPEDANRQFPPNTLFVHIKILLGLLRQDLVPSAPEIQELQEFCQRFANNNQVQPAATVLSSPALMINSSNVQIFKNATQGSVKLGRQIIHLGSNNVCYDQGLMVRLGLRTWCPNLKEDSASLYNAAHCITTITTFQELVAGYAYTYMSVNSQLATNTALYIQAYNHYVHYVLLNKYKKEKKETGKVAAEAQNKTSSKRWERYWDILAKPYGLLEESSNTKSEDGEAAGQGGPQNASNSQG